MGRWGGLGGELVFRRPEGVLGHEGVREVWRAGMLALVRLRGRLHGGVEVPVRPKHHRPVTEGYCVVATRGGELPEVNCQSVIKHHHR